MRDEAILKTIRALGKNRIPARYVENGGDLLAAVESFIAPGDVVGVGDSETLRELGVFDRLRTLNVEFLDKGEPGLTKEMKRDLYTRNFSADVFVSGLNAVTTDGRIFNLDGNGSRVAPIIYGPRKVVLVCGTNKIVSSDAEAIARIRSIAAPRDAKRLGKKTPCVGTGVCATCVSPEKICNYYAIIQGQFDANRITVLIVDGAYGF